MTQCQSFAQNSAIYEHGAGRVSMIVAPSFPHRTPMSERLFLSLPEDAGPGPETSTPTTHFTLLRIPHRLQWAVGSALIYREDFSADAPQWERVLPDGVVRIICDVS